MSFSDNKLPAAFDGPTDEDGAATGISDDFDFEGPEFGEAPAQAQTGRTHGAPTSPPAAGGQPGQARTAAGANQGRDTQQPDGASSIFSDQDYEVAGRYGLDRNQVDGLFGSVAELDSFLARVIQTARTTHSAATGGQAQNPGQQGQRIPDPAARQQDPSQSESPFQFQRFDRKVLDNPDLFDPESKKVFTQMIDHYESIIEKGIFPQLQAMQEAFQHQQFEAEIERFDSLIESLGETWQEVFGKGGSRSLTPTSPEGMARTKVFDEMDLLRETYQVTGRPVPGPKELFDRAVRSLHRDRFRQEARQEIGRQLRDGKGRFAAPPTSREGRALTPEERAVQKANAFYKNAGLGEGADDDDI